MRVSALLAGAWACLLVGDSLVDASPCCGLVAAAAVGGLAFAGGVAVGKHHHHHHHRRHGCSTCGCGGCGGNCGWCGGNYGRRRRRSIVSFIEDAEVQDVYAKVGDMNTIASEDKDQCGLRLVCELAQQDPRDLADDEVQILLPYKGAGQSDGTVYGQYDEAAWHGQEGHKCAEHFPLCAFTANQIMDEYRKYVSNNETFTRQQ
ncbi:uncharacterized protein LOC123518525 isoform X1 [Portunus trituberculatus]|uniref:Uncharacterized protein n=1 Tax=Portunus trituberculatus TaxID=210409 RepID=A0A5B7FPE7_PORTR|nr:uncharacterized protein LOC123518525 isoform X1 [Portunus trituberculatus]MPC48372.1 hypothetical protein [Portunus trituberculatus]